VTLTKTLAAATALAFMAGSALAAPCNTGSTAKAPDQNSPATSSTANGADKGSKNLAGGQQPASPGTVGAMNNVGAGQGVGDKPGSEQTAMAKNNAGGNQPAAPGTVGAMNATGADQKLGDKGGNDC
jgi:hypothetical protein